MSVTMAASRLSGSTLCARPGCQRVHRDGQGTRTVVGGLQVLTCFGDCAKWARAEAERRGSQ